jgi:hypothetical protein
MGIPDLWRTQKERYRLQGEVCPECSRLVFPPRRLCPYCGREAAASAVSSVQPAPRHEHVFVLPYAVEFASVGDD